MIARAAIYVDGFNMYHALADLNEPWLKWLDLWALGQLITPSVSERLVRAVYCTAYYPSDQDKRWRHNQYIKALAIRGVVTEEGHYITEPMKCRNCGGGWDKPTEKEGDINVAIHLLNDAWLDRYDHAYLVSADSDQAATARLFAAQFPDKRLTTVSPPGRSFSLHIRKYAPSRISLNRDHIARSLLPSVTLHPSGAGHIRRPRQYDPPKGWAPP